MYTYLLIKFHSLSHFKRDYKLKPIKEAYLKIIMQKQKDRNILNQEEIQSNYIILKSL